MDQLIATIDEHVIRRQGDRLVIRHPYNISWVILVFSPLILVGLTTIRLERPATLLWLVPAAILSVLWRVTRRNPLRLTRIVTIAPAWISKQEAGGTVTIARGTQLRCSLSQRMALWPETPRRP